MHPEYPCAHCIVSSAVASAVEAMLGTADIPEVTMTSPTALIGARSVACWNAREFKIDC